MQRFERNISILGRSKRTFDNYSRHVAAIALHFQCLPTELTPEQVKDYLYELQQRSKTPSETYFKHTVYGLRFLLKTGMIPLSKHLIRGIGQYISIEHPAKYLFEGSGNPEGKGFDGRYSQPVYNGR